MKILVVDDDYISRKNIARILRKQDYSVSVAIGGEEAIEIIKNNVFDLVLTDLVMKSINGLDLLTFIKKNRPEIEVILITGYGSVESAITALKSGAFHYLQKPIQVDELLNLVQKALESKCLKDTVIRLERKNEIAQDCPELVGKSRKISELRELIKRVAPSESSVMITGESGTGKELLASCIHKSSNRVRGQFLAINCGAFTEELLCNELFGHEKDAFTGARSSCPGILEACNGGTLFLDEIGDMPRAMQVKLLRAIEYKKVIRVGGTKQYDIDIRIISATNVKMKKAVEAGLFRQDLFYRLNVIPIHMPALVEYKSDIPLLINFFLNQINENSKKKLKGFSPDAIDILISYDYPGNVRELQNIIERASVMTSEEIIQPKDLPPDLIQFSTCTSRFNSEQPKSLADIEHEYIHWILEITNNNKSKAARILGIDRVSLYRKLKKYEISD